MKENTERPTFTSIRQIENMTTEQLSKATDELNQVIYDKFKLVDDNRVSINVGGRIFETSTFTLRYDPSSLLAITTSRQYG